MVSSLIMTWRRPYLGDRSRPSRSSFPEALPLYKFRHPLSLSQVTSFLQRMGGGFNIGGCLLLQDDPSYNLFWETAPTEHWHAFEDEAWGGGGGKMSAMQNRCHCPYAAYSTSVHCASGYACATCNSFHSPWVADRQTCQN